MRGAYGLIENLAFFINIRMFGGDKDYVDIAFRFGEAGIDADRKEFRKYLRLAEQIAKEGAVVIGDAATYMLLAKRGQVNKVTPPVRLDLAAPADRAEAIAKEIVDACMRERPIVASSRKFLDRWVVRVDEREVATVLELSAYRGAKFFDMLLPEEAEGPFSGEKLSCCNVEMQLIEKFAELCDPARAESWPVTYEIVKWLAPEGKTIVGGKKSVARKQKKSTGDFRRALVEFAKKPGRAFVPFSGKGERIRAITSFEFQEEQERLMAMAEKLGLFVQFQVNNPRTFLDQRMRKLTVYQQTPGATRVAVMDLYNTANYSLVPCVRPGVAAPAMVARILLVELWVLKLLVGIGALQSSTAEIQGSKFRAVLAKNITAASVVPPLDEFIGSAIPSSLAMKREMKKFPPPPYIRVSSSEN